MNCPTCTAEKEEAKLHPVIDESMERSEELARCNRCLRMYTQNTERVFEIPVSNLKKFKKKLARLTRKAEKCGVEPPTARRIGSYAIVRKERRVWYEDPIEYIDERVLFVVNSEIVKFPGEHVLIATLEHLEKGNIVRVVPGQEQPPLRFRSEPPHCEHCNKLRRRKDTHVIKTADGNFVQIGSSCIADFLGHKSAAHFAYWSELLKLFDDEADDELYEITKRVIVIDAQQYLVFVAASIRLFGWVPKSKANEWDRIPTSQDADIFMSDADKEGVLRNKNTGVIVTNKNGEEVRLIEEDRKLAKQALEWAQQISEQDRERSDYLYNIWLLANEQYWKIRQLGFGASIVAAYQRELEKQVKAEKAKEEAKEKKHVGEIKKRQQFEGLTLTGIFPVEGFYGTTYIHRFIDEDNNDLVWFSSKHTGFEVGKTYAGKGTVVKHDEFRGIPQTKINRCKFEEVE